MNCIKNGIKKKGESCTLNNNCIYPNCMDEETLEEAAENVFNDFKSKNPIVPQKHILPFKHGYIQGAKYMAERMYSEEEISELVYKIIGEYAKHYGIMIDGAKLNDLFEQFKKK